jgi:hypothetical protein
MGTRNNFFEMYRHFGQAHSTRYASAEEGCVWGSTRLANGSESGPKVDARKHASGGGGSTSFCTYVKSPFLNRTPFNASDISADTLAPPVTLQTMFPVLIGEKTKYFEKIQAIAAV